jgi:hypothetical protein
MGRETRPVHETMDIVLSGSDDSGGQFDRVEGMGPDDWVAIDEALGRFTAASVIPLLGAAIDAPWSRPWQHHLTLLWLRAVGVPPAGSLAATDPALAVLVNAAVEVARYPVLPPGVSNDARYPVGPPTERETPWPRHNLRLGHRLRAAPVPIRCELAEKCLPPTAREAFSLAHRCPALALRG